MRNSERPLVSIVTPVYNGEKFLDECIKSARRQTYTAWEYILVDNCSNDATSAIIREHSTQDPRIRSIRTTEVLPLIRNHNFALQQVSQQSDYCKILHADDLLFPHCLELMVAAAQENPTASIVGAYCLWGEKVVSDGIPLSTSLIPGRELCRLTLLNKLYCFWSPSALLLKSSLIRERGDFYTDEQLHADVAACYEVLQESDFAFVHQVLTFIRKHDNSATSRFTSSYNKVMLSNLELFLRFGPTYLSEEEYKSHLRTKSNKYYNYLASSVLDRRDKEFWEYHRRSCKSMGLPFSWTRIGRTALAKAIYRPVDTLKAVLGSAFGRRNPSGRQRH
jgi:glycosyltransferase involved in cell wall biosynthesis